MTHEVRSSQLSAAEETALLRLDFTKSLSLKEKLKILSTGATEFSRRRWWEEAEYGLCEPPDEQKLENSYQRIKELNIHLLPFTAPDYPASLENLPNPPLLLYARGNLSLLKEPLCAIVGTRNAAPAALEWTERIAGELGGRGLTVISGGAKGIDSAALRGALKGARPPLVVMGVAIDRFYPLEEAALQEEILGAGGLLLSEYPPGYPTQRGMFLARNRLLAALAQGTLMVSAAIPSGALSTAAWAAKLGRPLMTVPISPWEKAAAGNLLLLQKGAIPVAGLADITAALGHPCQTGRNLELPLTDNNQPPAAPLSPSLSATEQAIYTALATPLPQEDLMERIVIAPSELATALLNLELSGLIKKQATGLWIKR